MKKAKAMESNSETSQVVLPLLLVFFWLLSVVSALGVIFTVFESRKATQDLEELRRQADGLEVLSGQYVLEKSVWSNYSRVEEIARIDLNMIEPDSDQTVLVYKK